MFPSNLLNSNPLLLLLLLLLLPPAVNRSDMDSLDWVGILVGLLVGLLVLSRKVNGWYHEWKLEKKNRELLPPGDMGLPLLGNMWSFLRAFKSGKPDDFINSFVCRYGRIGIYKAFMFGSPTILITVPELSKQVLMDDEHFIPGWPKATMELIGNKSFIGISQEEHRRLRRMTSAPINGQDALSTYLIFMEELAISTLDKWGGIGEIEFLTELRRYTFRIIIQIFLSSEQDNLMAMNGLETAYTHLNYGMRAMSINLPGFAYYKALKARKKIVNILQHILNVRRRRTTTTTTTTTADGIDKKDMMDQLMEVEDENGSKLDDEEIIDILIMYLNAGHESSGHITMWATVFLQENPICFKKAKEEQEEIRRNMPSVQKGLLTMKEIRKMEYLSKVIDETLRIVNISFVSFREATADVDINGYMIPKGWKVQVWYRNVHMDPEVHTNPRQFNPSRWDGIIPKVGTFLPFGGGSRLCPGNELAKLEISVFLHYFLLDYRLKRRNPQCPIRYLPHPRPTDNCRARIQRTSSSITRIRND